MTAARPVDPSVSATPLPLDADDLPTVCVLCSHNCGLRVDVQDGKITAVRADETNPITTGYICNKAMGIPHYVDHKQRVQHPLRRRPDGTFVRATWGEAITDIASRLNAIREAHGPRAIGLVGIGGQGNHLDAPYGLGWLRAAGSRRWFNSFAQEKTQHALMDQWMFAASPAAFLHTDQHHVEWLLVLGTNPRISNRGHNPTETFKAFQADKTRTMVVVDPRETETTRGATRHLRIRPGGDVWLLLGMAATIVKRVLYRTDFVRERTVGFDALAAALAEVDVAEMARRAGLTEAEVVETAEGFAAAEKASIFYDLGVEQNLFSTLISYLIRVLLVLTDNLGREGGSVFFETLLPPVHEHEGGRAMERALASGIPAIAALGNFGMFSPTLVPEEIMVDHPERLRALVVEGSNPILSFSDASRWREAREQLDLLVVIDPAMTETAALADWVLPVPVGYEKWEFANFPKGYPEIFIQVRPPVVPGPREALPEAEIYARLGEAMGLFPPPSEDLRALGAGALTPEGAMAFLGTAQAEAAANGDPKTSKERLIFAAYRSVGPHLPSPALSAIWIQCHLNAMMRAPSVLRTLGSEWESRSPFEIGTELWRRTMAHPEGVEFARQDAARNLDDHLGFGDGKIRLGIEPMLEEIRRALATPPTVDPAYPFVMAAGLRTRWTANTIQRDPTWRKGRGPHCALNLSPADARTLGVKDGDAVRVVTNRGAVLLPAQLDSKLLPGHVWMPNGFGMRYPSRDADVQLDGANQNELTDTADRDPFTGIPHHRHVRCRIEPVGPPAR
jgi:anaerobic selenocysteine-containing dehydrogenase